MTDNSTPAYEDPHMMANSASEDGMVWYPVTLPVFGMTGAYNYVPGEGFERIPQVIADATNDGVQVNNHHTAGVHIRFKTNAKKIGVRVLFPYLKTFTHMPLSGTGGFDLYVDHEEKGQYSFSEFLVLYRPKYDVKDYYEEIQEVSGETQYYTLNFPLYNAITTLEIGFSEGAFLEPGMPYRNELPVVYYGSSITQGACASRPGLSYEARISRTYNLNYVNLGYSGHAKGEQVIMEYISKIPMSLFVYDYDHNSSVEELAVNHKRGYEIVRRVNPDLPIIFVTRPDGRRHVEASKKRFDIIRETYESALINGDKNVYFVDGFQFYAGEHPEDCSVDGLHPNDEGFAGMAKYIGLAVKEALKL